MFLELLRKEFIQRKSDEKQSPLGLVFSIFFALLLLGSFIALECYIALVLDKKINQYSPYGSFDFLAMFLFALMLLDVIFTMVKARKTIFDQKDNRLILPLPISPSTQVLSKVVYLYIESILFSLVTASPLLICYGLSRGYIPYYYVFSILYPFLISIFSVGLSLLLSLLYQQIYKLIKRSDVAQFLSASVIVILLCYLYQFVLNLFLTALNDSSIGGMFSSSFVDALHNATHFLMPVYYLLDLVTIQSNVACDILFFLGFSLLLATLGIGFTSVIYLHELKRGGESGRSKERPLKKKKLLSPFKTLLKKESDLLFKDETNLFSYTSLLILCPFLTHAVISSLNGIIYDNLRFYATYFPELISGINLTLILLFSSVINASASKAMSREKKALIIVKYIPVSPFKQILAKLIMPISLSLVSLLLTDLVLLSTGIITVSVFFSSLFIGALMIVFSNVFGIYCDMHDMDEGRRGIKLSPINDLVPIVLPLLIFISFFLLSVFAFFPSWALYLFACAMSLVLLSPSCISLKKRYLNSFGKMEVSN